MLELVLGQGSGIQLYSQGWVRMRVYESITPDTPEYLRNDSLGGTIQTAPLWAASKVSTQETKTKFFIFLQMSWMWLCHFQSLEMSYPQLKVTSLYLIPHAIEVGGFFVDADDVTFHSIKFHAPSFNPGIEHFSSHKIQVNSDRDKKIRKYLL